MAAPTASEVFNVWAEEFRALVPDIKPAKINAYLERARERYMPKFELIAREIGRRLEAKAKAREQEDTSSPASASDELTPEVKAALDADYGAFVSRFEGFLPEASSPEEAANMAAAARQEAMLRSRGWGHHWKNVAMQCQINARTASKRQSGATKPKRGTRRAEAMSRSRPAARAGVSLHVERSTDGNYAHITVGGPNAIPWVKEHSTLLGKRWTIKDRGPHMMVRFTNDLADRVERATGMSVSVSNWEQLPRSPRAPSAMPSISHLSDSELDGIIDAAIDGAGGDMMPEVSFSIADYDGETQMRLGELARGAGWLTAEKGGDLTLINPFFVNASPEEIEDALTQMAATDEIEDFTDDIDGTYLPGDTVVDRIPTFEAAMPRSRASSRR